MVRMFCISDWTTSQYGSCGIDFFGLLAIQPLPPLLLSPCTDDLISSDTSLKRYTLRDLLSSRLQSCHRRVPPLEKTIPLHHTAHRCTCRWRTTNPSSSPCTPDDKWDGDVHNPADPDRETCLCNAGHTRKGGYVWR